MLMLKSVFQSLHPLDPSRLFGWQAANTLNTTGKITQGSTVPLKPLQSQMYADFKTIKTHKNGKKITCSLVFMLIWHISNCTSILKVTTWINQLYPQCCKKPLSLKIISIWRYLVFSGVATDPFHWRNSVKIVWGYNQHRTNSDAVLSSLSHLTFFFLIFSRSFRTTSLLQPSPGEPVCSGGEPWLPVLPPSWSALICLRHFPCPAAKWLQWYQATVSIRLRYSCSARNMGPHTHAHTQQ